MDNSDEREQSIARPTVVRIQSSARSIPRTQETEIPVQVDVPVTRQRTSIRRIFTWFGADFPLFRAISSIRGDAAPRPLVTPTFSSDANEAFSVPAFKIRAFRTATSYRTDIIVLYTNAVRHEMQALFMILSSMHERKQCNLETGDIESFFIWFIDFHDFFCNFVSLINDILLPSLRDFIPFRHTTPQYFASEGQSLNRIVAKTLSTQERFMKLYSEPGRAASKLIQIYSDFAQPLMSYLFHLEKYCSDVYDRFLTAQAAANISRTMADVLKRMPHFKRCLPILLRWLEHRPHTTSIWLIQHYDYVTVRSYRLWRRPTEHERTLEYFALVSNIHVA